MIPYSSGSILTVASPGSHQPEVADCFLGKMRSRASAKLEYTMNDVRALREKIPTFGGYVEDKLTVYDLVDPSKEELVKLVRNVAKELRSSPCDKTVLGFTPISRTVELRVDPSVCAFPVVAVF